MPRRKQINIKTLHTLHEEGFSEREITKEAGISPKEVHRGNPIDNRTKNTVSVQGQPPWTCGPIRCNSQSVINGSPAITRSASMTTVQTRLI